MKTLKIDLQKEVAGNSAPLPYGDMRPFNLASEYDKVEIEHAALNDLVDHMAREKERMEYAQVENALSSVDKSLVKQMALSYETELLGKYIGDRIREFCENHY